MMTIINSASAASLPPRTSHRYCCITTTPATAPSHHCIQSRQTVAQHRPRHFQQAWQCNAAMQQCSNAVCGTRASPTLRPGSGRSPSGKAGPAAGTLREVLLQMGGGSGSREHPIASRGRPLGNRPIETLLSSSERDDVMTRNAGRVSCNTASRKRIEAICYGMDALAVFPNKHHTRGTKHRQFNRQVCVLLCWLHPPLRWTSNQTLGR